MRNGSYLPASIKWQNTSLSVSELAPLMRPATGTAGSISLSSLLCLTVHFSARIFDLERYESRRSEGEKEGKERSGINSFNGLGLSPLSALPRGDVLTAPSPLKEVCQNIPCFFVSNISLVVSSSSRVRRRLEAMLAIYSYKTVRRNQ